MFDFQGTLKEADDAAAKGEYVTAIYNYWMIGYAFEDEEFPYGYTREIGEKASKCFLKYMRKHKKKILQDEVYLKMKEALREFKTFQNFERVVNSFFYTKRKKHQNDELQEEYISDFDIW